MRTRLLAAILTSLALSVPLYAGSWDGTIKVGGISVDEEGDKSTMQETFNIHDGFSISQLRLTGAPGTGNYLLFDVHEINHESRRGEFLFRRRGAFRLSADFDQHRQVFDPDRTVTSERKDWNFGARVTPVRWLSLDGRMNYNTRTGERMSYPAGTMSVLGHEYDYTMVTGEFSAEASHQGRGLAVDYRATDFSDDLNVDADRTGNVIAGRAWFPYWISTHLLRASYGKSELANGDVDYTLSTFQYTSVLKPMNVLRLKYRFNVQRVENTSTDLQTDRFQNDLDATYYLPNGSLTGGYGYEMNDDDRRLTEYHTWRAGATLRDKYIRAKAYYADRQKKDTEELTLLKDVEASRFRGSLEILPTDNLSFNGAYHVREREFPDIEVMSEGSSIQGGGRYSLDGWGAVSCSYAYNDDEYTDLAGGYHATSHVVTGRVDFDRVKNLRLGGGVSYIEAGEDLDIEKSILFFEAKYKVQKHVHLEAKYNVYNYDDFVVLDRYYTANVVWFNVAYDLHQD